MVFDSACRVLLFEIAKKHGLHLEEEPEYGGRRYLEKQDFILAKQKEQIAQQEQEIQRQDELIESQRSGLPVWKRSRARPENLFSPVWRR